MDAAFNQHQTRRKNRSTTNLNHLSLAPLTPKLPLGDDDLLFADGADYGSHDAGRHGSHHYRHSTSYLQGKSAPTTPGILERSPARSASHARLASLALDDLPKRSKSTTHLVRHAHGGHHHYAPAPGRGGAGRRRRKHDDGGLSAADRSDSDWLLRAGALISSETRESKGQSWLVSRASSTSLTAMQPRGGDDGGDGGGGGDDGSDSDADPERDPWAASRYGSRRGSRRGSLAFAGDEPSAASSAPGSRLGSRSHSRAAGPGGRSRARTPLERGGPGNPEGGYFAAAHGGHHHLPGPDFVNLDEKLEAVSSAEAARDTSREDEAHVRRLVRSGGAGAGTWLGGVLGWRLFAVEEDDDEEEGDDEDDEEEEEDEEGGGSGSGSGSESEAGPPSSRGGGEGGSAGPGGERRRSGARRRFEGGAALVPDRRIPPPKADEGGWRDAAWLLSVASKVLL